MPGGSLRKAGRRRIICSRKTKFGGSAMSALSRRRFLELTGSATAVALSAGANAAMGPNDKFDLVIKGGDVLDTSKSLRGKRYIGIRWGTVAAYEEEIHCERRSTTNAMEG